MQTITFIGNGNMGLSIAKGLKDKYTIEVVGRSMEKLHTFEKNLGVEVKKYLLDDFVMEGKTILFCVKPANLEEVAAKLKGRARVIFSVLAGTSVEKLKSNLKTDAVVRTMPNLAASVGKSMTTLTGDASHKEEAKTLLGAIGEYTLARQRKRNRHCHGTCRFRSCIFGTYCRSTCRWSRETRIKREDAMATMKDYFPDLPQLFKRFIPHYLKMPS